MEARIAELVALGVILLSVWEGAHRGLVMKVYSLIRFVLFLVVTLVLLPLLLPLIPADAEAREGIAFLVSLVLSGVLIGAVARVLKLVDHIPVVNQVNKLGGAIIGLLLGVVFVWIILLIIGSFQDKEWCRPIAYYIRQSQILMEVQRFNPLPIVLRNLDFPVLTAVGAM